MHGEAPKNINVSEFVLSSSELMESSEGQTYSVKGTWTGEDVNINNFWLLAIQIRVNITYEGDFIDVTRVKLDNLILCHGKILIYR
jgi:hypothetical protein